MKYELKIEPFSEGVMVDAAIVRAGRHKRLPLKHEGRDGEPTLKTHSCYLAVFSHRQAGGMPKHFVMTRLQAEKCESSRGKGFYFVKKEY